MPRRNFPQYFKVHKLDNGHIAYVYRSRGSYGSDRGLYELKLVVSVDDPSALHIPSITGNIDATLGYLTMAKVEETLAKCRLLPAR